MPVVIKRDFWGWREEYLDRASAADAVEISLETTALEDWKKTVTIWGGNANPDDDDDDEFAIDVIKIKVSTAPWIRANRPKWLDDAACLARVLELEAINE